MFVHVCVFGTFDWNRYRGNLDENRFGPAAKHKNKMIKTKKYNHSLMLSTFNLYLIETLVYISHIFHFRGKRRKN